MSQLLLVLLMYSCSVQRHLIYRHFNQISVQNLVAPRVVRLNMRIEVLVKNGLLGKKT